MRAEEKILSDLVEAAEELASIRFKGFDFVELEIRTGHACISLFSSDGEEIMTMGKNVDVLSAEEDSEVEDGESS